MRRTSVEIAIILLRGEREVSRFAALLGDSDFTSDEEEYDGESEEYTHYNWHDDGGQ
jgi:hypothetical protein